MEEMNKNKISPGMPPPEDDVVMDEALQQKLKELDKESNTMDYTGIWGKFIAAICICFSLFQIYTGFFGVMDAPSISPSAFPWSTSSARPNGPG